MKKTRNNIFETNSSSTHSLTCGRVLGKDYIPYGDNLKIEWFNNEKPLTTLKEKISYLVSHIASWYVYNAEDYDDLIEQVKNDWDFKRIENYVWKKYGKKIIFPKYDGDLEDMVEINHQLVAWNHNLDEVLEDIVSEERDYLAEVLEDGKDIEFGRD